MDRALSTRTFQIGMSLLSLTCCKCSPQYHSVKTCLRAIFHLSPPCIECSARHHHSSFNSMEEMFKRTSSFDRDISPWDIPSGTTMRYMFQVVPSFNRDLSLWDVSSVTDIMYGMFLNATSFNKGLSSQDVSSVTDMRGMFHCLQ